MLLIKGAHVVDPQVGLDTVTDVLVEGARIARVGANIKAPEGAEVIDGTSERYREAFQIITGSQFISMKENA